MVITLPNRDAVWFQEYEKGKHIDDEVVMWNANECEIHHNYDYKTPLQCKSFTEISARHGLGTNENQSPPNYKHYSMPEYWMLDTLIINQYILADGGLEEDYHDHHTLMLGNRRPHRHMMWDLFCLYDMRNAHSTFQGIGVKIDIDQDHDDELGRVHWNAGNQRKTHMPPPWYKHVLFDVVVETHETIQFYTEKTFKPLLFKKIPLIFGAKNMYDQLREWGFMFCSDVINYDFVVEPHSYMRAKKLVEELRRIMRTYSPQELADITRPSREHNYRQYIDLCRNYKWPHPIEPSVSYQRLIDRANKVANTLDIDL